MNKKAALAVLILVGAIGMGAAEEPQRFANVSFTFWKAGSGAGGIIGFRELREVLIGDTLSIPLAGSEAASRVIEKEGYRFVLSVESKEGLVIDIFRGGAALHGIRMAGPSGSEFIFYDGNSRKHGIDVTFTVNDHRIGMVSPGIRR